MCLYEVAILKILSLTRFATNFRCKISSRLKRFATFVKHIVSLWMLRILIIRQYLMKLWICDTWWIIRIRGYILLWVLFSIIYLRWCIWSDWWSSNCCFSLSVTFVWFYSVIVFKSVCFIVLFYICFYRAMIRRAWLWDCMSSVCPSVRPSIRPWRWGMFNSLRSLLTLTPKWAIWCNANTPKIRVE